MTSTKRLFGPLLTFVFVSSHVIGLAGCGSADKQSVYPTATPPADARSGDGSVVARDVTGSTTGGSSETPAERPVVHAEAKSRGIFGGSGGGDEELDKPKKEFQSEKKVALAEPPRVIAQAPPPPSPPNGSSPAPAGPQPSPPPPQQPPPASNGGQQQSAVLKADPTKEPAQNRDLVIYTARFTMAVYQVDQGLAAVEKIARDNNGYLGQKKDREITIRIPRGRFEPTLSAIDKIGDVLHREIQALDVTDEHVDLEIRIKNARAMQKRLSDLLVKASVKDALEIEKELHRVTEELERLEGKMKVLKDKVAFSTITVAFEARGTTIQTARVRLPFPWLGGLNLPSLLSLSEDK